MTQATELRELASLLRVNGGNVGIGPLTADPPYTLSLGQTNVAGAQTIRLAGNGNPKHEIQFREAGVDYGFTIRYAGDALDNKLHIVAHENSSNGAEAISISRSTGNVGIGNASPDHQLDVEGGNNVFDLARFGSSGSDNSEVTIGYFDANATNGIPALITASDFGGLIQGGEHGHLVLGIRDNDNTDALDIVSGGGDFMTDSTYDTLVATFRADGNVGIGTNSPDSALTVNTSTTGDGIELQSSEVSIAKLTRHVVDSTVVASLDGVSGRPIHIGGVVNEKVILGNAGGNVGIGTDSPTTELEVAGTAKSDQYLIDAVSKDVTVTARDVFVYDTRKDSDGGAWRKRTQHTSWYNEDSDSRRSTRKDFPAVAVIVAHSAGVTIYDGDDPDMPMWMVIFAAYSHNFSIGFSQGGAPTAVTARDGVIYTTTNGGVQDNSVNGLFAHNFVSDRMYQWNSSGGGGFGYYRLPIEGRDSGGSLAYHESVASFDTSKRIVSQFLNDVSVTVLPNAPIDAETGLPVPTIAVASDDGISIINNDLTVANRAQTQSQMDVGRIDFTGKGSAYTYLHSWGGVTHDARIVSVEDGNEKSTVSIPYGKYDSDYASFETGIPDPRFTQSNLYSNRFYHYNSGPFIGGTENGPTRLAGNTAGGVLAITNFDPDHDLINYISNDFNTGWQGAYSRLATLSDTDDTNVTGTELVTNGTFDSNITGWVASDSGCSLSLVSNKLRLTNNDQSAAGAVTSFSVVAGESYCFSVGTSSAAVWLYLGASVNTATYFGPIVSNTTTWKSSTTGTVYFMIKNSSTSNGATIDIDNISVRLAEEDHSVLNKGVQVFGSITKNPVATGAELVAYSNFSSSHYLQQPYNSTLDFGTGDCTYTWWGTAFDSGSDRLWFTHGKYNSAGSGLNVLQYNSGGSGDEAHFYIGNAGAGYIIVTGVENAGWDCWIVTRRSGIMYVYRNGKLQGSVANSNNINLSTDQAFGGVTIGAGVSGSSVFASGAKELSLFRISGTATTPEQAAKIYNDERRLFATNAKATIYGTSSSVQGLAYDDDTELLHVGTSSGSSTFQGLNRIDNTTDAVTVAISASNGMVVEE